MYNSNIRYWLKFEQKCYTYKSRDVVARNMVNNDQKYTLSWYPTGGSIERIPSLIEEKQDQSKKFSNVRMTIGSLNHELWRMSIRNENIKLP